MTDKITPPNPEEAQALLLSLFEEVKKQEGTLSGGKQLGDGATAVESVLQTQVSFGNPRDNLILLTEKIFQDTGVELTSFYRQQMRDTYNFYYMTVTVDLSPKPSAKFWRLCCQLDFHPKGESEPIIQTIFPESKWRTVMKWGVGMNLGLNANLDWSLGVDASKLAEIAHLPGELKANVASKNEMRAFIVMDDYPYEAGRFEIFAQGSGSSKCFWRIEKPELQKMATVKFAIVFKVPKGCKSIDLSGIVWAEPNINWLFENIEVVFSALSERLKNLFPDREKAASSLARTASEQWTLTLPKANY